MSFSEQVAAALQVPTGTAYGVLGVDLPRERWVDGVRTCRDGLGLGFFDLLTAVDQLAEGMQVVLRLWSVQQRQALVLRTTCPVGDLRVPSLVAVFAGASWHERATAEMFGIVFEGHPGLTPLLLPDGFEGHPLRKDVVLAARVDRPWPGAKEPGESDADLVAGGRRRRAQPPGAAR